MVKALIIVDVQKDFVEGGSLAVEGGKAVATKITEFLNENSGDYSVIVATRDWHESDNSNGGHFSDSPDFVDTWPKHCVQGTDGADYADEFDTSRVEYHVVKGMGRPAYSGFEGVVTDTSDTLESLLKKHDVEEVTVVGIATNYCVEATAIDAVTAGFDTVVIAGLSAAIGDPTESYEKMRSHGVKIVD